jgi:hypothetical protein
MGKGMSPRDPAAWMRWAERKFRVLDRYRADATLVPVGGAVLWTGTGTPPAAWLTADGSTFAADEYPELEDALGGATLPTLTAVSGRTWIIRAE